MASGLIESRLINDYPIRNILLTLYVKQHRCVVEINGQITNISRDWSVVAEGTRMRAEYPAF